MFKKLRNQLTMVNIAVFTFIMILILATIFLTTYTGLQRELTQLQIITELIANSDTSFDIVNSMRGHVPEMFVYVKISSDGTIIETYPNVVDYTRLQALVSQIYHTSSRKGVLYIDHKMAFNYCRAQCPNGDSVILLSNVSPPQIVLHNLWISVLKAGGVGIILTLIGSWFMAEQSLAPIKRSWKRQQAFVSDASHELRTPLAVIRTNLELVMSNPEETVGSQQEWLDNMLSEVAYVSNLVDRLTFLARADTRVSEMDKEAVQLDHLITQHLQPLMPALSEKDLTLEVNTEPCTVWGNEPALTQMLRVLLDNAMQYTPASGTIKVTLKQDENNVILAVSDTGIGIDPEHLPHIFERFYRADKVRTRDGFGLGLSIAQEIVHNHRGHISVESVPGQGSTFTVTIPRIESENRRLGVTLPAHEPKN